jgi:hypothetical protein
MKKSYSFLFPSPGKYFLLLKLKTFFKKNGPFNLTYDIASAGFKYRSFFKTKSYVGYDLHEQALVEGYEKYSRPDDSYKCIDIRQWGDDVLADCIVSTHTFGNFEVDEYMDIIKKLNSNLKKGGFLFLNIPVSKENIKIKHFFDCQYEKVYSRTYSGITSTYFEAFFGTISTKNSLIKVLPYALGVPFAFINTLFIEFTGITKLYGSYKVYICYNKK